MTPEQNLIAALKEAIALIREHDARTSTNSDESIEKWLAVRVTCKACDGEGQYYHGSWVDCTAMAPCQPCNGTGKRPLREVI